MVVIFISWRIYAEIFCLYCGWGNVRKPSSTALEQMPSSWEIFERKVSFIFDYKPSAVSWDNFVETALIARSIFCPTKMPKLMHTIAQQSVMTSCISLLQVFELHWRHKSVRICGRNKSVGMYEGLTVSCQVVVVLVGCIYGKISDKPW